MDNSPICPTCSQPGTLALAAPTERWECRNEACPEFGQVLDPRSDVYYHDEGLPPSGIEQERA